MDDGLQFVRTLSSVFRAWRASRRISPATFSWVCVPLHFAGRPLRLPRKGFRIHHDAFRWVSVLEIDGCFWLLEHCIAKIPDLRHIDMWRPHPWVDQGLSARGSVAAVSVRAVAGDTVVREFSLVNGGLEIFSRAVSLILCLLDTRG